LTPPRPHKLLTPKDVAELAKQIAEHIVIQPRWLKLKQAATYSGIGQKRLKSLAENGEITGYSDQNSGRGDWIFDKESIDEYRLKPVQETSVRFKKFLDGIGA